MVLKLVRRTNLKLGWASHCLMLSKLVRKNKKKFKITFGHSPSSTSVLILTVVIMVEIFSTCDLEPFVKTF